MTDKIFNLQVELAVDDDRGRKQDRKLLEHILGISTRINPNCYNVCLAFFYLVVR